ncbi:MAG: SIR2 family protein [Anaerolineaceae bacterium]|nr:SIR2 family protein [Anaerolineaceae bacterium]
MIEIPFTLKHSLESGDCVLFVGAGVGQHFLSDKGEPAPDGYNLAKEMAEEFRIDLEGDYELTTVSRLVELRKGRKELISFLKNRLSNLSPDDIFGWICKIKWAAIYTTNYDSCIEKCYDMCDKPFQSYKSFSISADLVKLDSRFDVPIYHLHGMLFGTDNPNVVITDDDYTKYSDRRKMMFDLLKYHTATANILYIGYSNRDPNWKLIQNEIAEEYLPNKMPQAYRVDPFSTAENIEILKAKNIETIKADFSVFASSSLAVLDIDSIAAFDKDSLKKNIPSNLIGAFDKNPVATTRLLSSWTYVNQAAFHSSDNIDSFIKGDRPNWAIMASNKYFERDKQEEIYDEILDFVTETKQSVRSTIILGPAGYGTTTLLMTLAFKLVSEKAGSVFMFRPGNKLLSGDILYACDSIIGKIVLFIDDAADNIGEITLSIQKVKESKKDIMIILAERLNEWRQLTNKLRTNEHIIEPLSDGEIDRLLKFLTSNNALNKLADLPEDFRKSAIKKNYNKELLVAMKEATEGKGFDAIIEDEYRGIGGDKSKEAYLVVSCFYQKNSYIRDDLLANILNEMLTTLYDKLKDSTEGVIIFDILDESMGIYGARARHRTIAKIVWDRCGSFGTKDVIAYRIIDNLNLNFSQDAKAFESFYMSDMFVDSISTVQGRIDFFERACKKDPDSPFVRQHYARMLLRAKMYSLAIGQIDSAIEIGKQSRVLYHTKAVILSGMCEDEQSIEMARKYMIHSESLFVKAKIMQPRDNYCYVGLAQLYIKWINKIGDADEQTEYLSKAEEIINEGLRNTREREALWIESANIKRLVGNNPAYGEKLNRAISETPQSIIARYLLGRHYRINGEYSKAIDILYYVIKNFPDQYRTHIEYVYCMYCNGKTLSECIAVLNQAKLYGYNDPRYICTLGGMYFLNGEFSEAARIFGESEKRHFTATEMDKAQYKPIDTVDRIKPYRLQGKVVKVKPGYSLIECDGYPDPFLCPGSKYGGIIFESGMKIDFRLVFRPKGPLAVEPKQMI